MKLIGRVAAIAAAGLLALPARAQEDDKARAKAAYASGQAEYNLGHFDKALQFYEAAYKIKPVPALLFNIAQCHRQMGDMRSAATTYKAFLRTAKEADPGRPKAVALLEEVEAALKKQDQAREAQPLGTVADNKAIDEKKANADAPPEVDATAGPELDATPGEAPKAQPAVAKVEGEKLAANMARPKEPAPVEAVTAAPAEGQPAKKGRTLTWIAAGASVVALGGGAFFGMKSKSTAADLESNKHTTEQINQLRPTVSSDAGKANLMFATGAVLAVAAGTFFVLRF